MTDSVSVRHTFLAPLPFRHCANNRAYATRAFFTDGLRHLLRRGAARLPLTILLLCARTHCYPALTLRKTRAVSAPVTCVPPYYAHALPPPDHRTACLETTTYLRRIDMAGFSYQQRNASVCFCGAPFWAATRAVATDARRVREATLTGVAGHSHAGAADASSQCLPHFRYFVSLPGRGAVWRLPGPRRGGRVPGVACDATSSSHPRRLSATPLPLPTCHYTYHRYSRT